MRNEGHTTLYREKEIDKMKKKTWIILAVVAVVLLLVISLVSSYNRFVDLQTNTETKTAAIQVQLQRRADLIPNFVATVKGYSEY